MFEGFKRWLNGDVQFQPSQAVRTAPAGLPLTAANDGNYSLTGEANQVLTSLFRRQQVVKHGPNGTKLQAAFPLKEVTLSTSEGYNSDDDRGLIRLDGEGRDTKPHGQSVTLEATLAAPLEDYDPGQLKAALVRVVSAIPAFRGKVVAKPIALPHASYKDVKNELLAALGDDVPADVKAGITGFLDATPGKQDAAPGNQWSAAIGVSHHEGKISIDMRAETDTADSGKPAPVESSDEAIVTYFKQHRGALLEKLKAKVLALRKPDGTPLLNKDDLATLDLHATTGYGVRLLLGTTPDPKIDPLTQKKLVGEERANKFTATPLAKVDTEQLKALFSEALAEIANPLPPLLEKFADPHMVAQMLRQRMPGNTVLETVLAKHDMFLSYEQKKAKEPKVEPGQIMLEEPKIYANGGLDSKRSFVSLTFDLPEKMTLHHLNEHIAANKNQLATGMQTMTEHGGRAA